MWCGKKSNYFERLKANELAIAIRDTELSGRGKIEIIDEGSEPDDVNEVSTTTEFLQEMQKYFCHCFFSGLAKLAQSAVWDFFFFVQELSKGGPKPQNLPEKEFTETAVDTDVVQDKTNESVASLYLVNTCK